MVEAMDPSKMLAPTSMPKTKKVFRNFHLIWMCIWISPYHIAAGLAKQGSSYLEL